MFLEAHHRTKDGKRHTYFTLVESKRTQRGPRQRIIAELGELSLDEMAFSRSRRSEQQQVTAFPDELTGGQLIHLLAFDGRVELPVEVLQGLGVTEVGGTHAAGQQPVRPHGQFVLENQFQEFRVIQSIAAGLL